MLSTLGNQSFAKSLRKQGFMEVFMFTDEKVKKLGHAAKVLAATVAEKMPLADELKENAIAISSRLASSDVFTSVQVFQFFCEISSREKITKEIPDKNEEELSHLNEQGIAQIGKEIHFGNVLIGKTIMPLNPCSSTEEKMLAAIFGKKRRKRQFPLLSIS
jgi:hypothetical protein